MISGMRDKGQRTKDRGLTRGEMEETRMARDEEKREAGALGPWTVASGELHTVALRVPFPVTPYTIVPRYIVVLAHASESVVCTVRALARRVRASCESSEREAHPDL